MSEKVLFALASCYIANSFGSTYEDLISIIKDKAREEYGLELNDEDISRIRSKACSSMY